MAATAAAEDDESWLYGESIQDEKDEKEEESERHMSDDGRDESNQDETSRVSRFSSDDLPAAPGKEDQSNSPTPSADLAKRSSDDKEAGELSGEEESAAAPTSEKENQEKSGEADGVQVKDDADGDEDGEGADGEAAPHGEAGSDDSDSDDDSVQVTIGDIKAGPPVGPYGYNGPPVNLNIKRGSGYQPSGVGGQSTGKGKGVDLESVGMINGVPTYEFNLDTMEDKPWRKPGADITDYFNYGFNEDTWKAYCEKQRKLRVEANGNLGGLAAGSKAHHAAKDQQIPIATVNENSKYAGALGKKAGPPPGRKISGSIDVIGASTTTSRRAALTAPKENVIQVVTADKREYSRKPFIDTNMPPPPPGVIPPGLPIFPDLSMPPPGMPPPGMPPPGIPPPNISMMPGVMPTFGEPFDYNRSYPPPPGVPMDRPPPGFDNTFEGGYFNGSNSGQDPYNPFEPTGDGPWESRDGSGSRYHKKDWDYHRSNDRSPPRSPDGEDYEGRRHRDYRERDRDKSRDRDRDRERDRERERERDRGDRESEVRETRESRHRERHSESRHRERDRERESRARDYEPEERRERDRSERGESERRHREHRDRDEKHSRSSRRKHREENDETEHRSSRHKRKRSKREKEEENASASAERSASAAAASEANESQDAPAENQDEDSQQD